MENSSLIDDGRMLVSRLSAQAASERRLFSETFGLGGYDTIRGFDERTLNSDHGWLGNLEFDPQTMRWGCDSNAKTLRPYTFVDLGQGWTSQHIAAEVSTNSGTSTGVGFRFTMSDQLIARFD